MPQALLSLLHFSQAGLLGSPFASEDGLLRFQTWVAQTLFPGSKMFASPQGTPDPIETTAVH